MIMFKDCEASAIFGSEFVNIKFEIEDTTEDLTNYTFDLWRSGLQDKDFVPVYSNIQSFECNDYTVSLLNEEIKNHYKIKATNHSNGEASFSDVFSLGYTKPDEYATYLIEIYKIYLEDVINNKDMLLIRKRRSGQVCDCYDDVRGSSRYGDKCPHCYGVGYLGGYYQPVNIKVNFFNPVTEQEEMSLRGTFENNGNRQVWTSNYPIIQEGDILIDGVTGERSSVISCQLSNKSGYLIRQTLQTAIIPRANIVYKFPI